MIRALLPIACVLLVTWGARTQSRIDTAHEPQGTIEVSPAKVSLDGAASYSQLLVTQIQPDGRRADWTRRIRQIAGGELAKVDERGLLRPVADGSGELELEVDGRRIYLPVEVRGLGAQASPSFVQDVMPIFSAKGCNSGKCHGSQAGQNGFKLSLRGYDAIADHRALTDDLSGRRFNRAAPERSLFLRKATGRIPHEGGPRLDAAEPDFAVLRAWIESGVPIETDEAEVVRIELDPAKPTIETPGTEQQFRVIAHYANGRSRDVTAHAFFESSDIEVLTMDERGLASTLRRGDAAILARYEGRYAATRLFVMGDREGFEWREVPEHNYVDTLVYQRLREIATQPSELCTDDEFLRRLSLDLIGRPPTPKETMAFLLDARPTRVKRDEVIDRRIGSAEFVEHWTNRWSDLLQVNAKFLGQEGTVALREWIRAQIASNTPYDRFVREVLTASGSTIENPPAAYYKVLRKPDLAMENTTQLFLGVRFNCNKCHDHPFERWTKDQHWSLAAYFAGVERRDAEGSKKMRRSTAAQAGEQAPAFEEIISDGATATIEDAEGVTHAAAFPYAVEAATSEPGASSRLELASWLTHPENPYFVESYVNRLWSYFLGVGLIDPVDDIRAGNPPTLPDLLARLAEDFRSSGFDVRHMMRVICRSRVYQHSIETNDWNGDDRLHFARALPRRLPAEALFDAIYAATGSRTRLPGTRPGVAATELVDSGIETTDGFLGLFGRPPRESACECERKSNVSLGQALNLVNGPTLADAIRDPDNDIAQLVAYGASSEEILRDLYVRFLCRPPTDAELSALMPDLDPLRIENASALGPEDAQTLREGLEKFDRDSNVPTWSVANAGTLKSSNGAMLEALEDGSVLVSGESPDVERYTVVLHTDQADITGLRLEALPHESFPGQGPGRAENGNFVLARVTVDAVPLGDTTAAAPVKLSRATADFSQKGWPVAETLTDSDKGWAILPKFGERHVTYFELEENIGSSGGTLLIVSMDQPYGSQHTLGRFRWSVTSSPRPIRHHGLPADLVTILALPPAERSEAQNAAVFRHYVGKNAELASKIRLGATQDMAWALANSSSFLFNR